MALSSTYTYKVLKSSWGIRISITAEVLKGEGDSVRSIPLGEGVFLLDGTPAKALTDGVMGMLGRGLKLLVPEIASSVSERPITIAVREIRYNDADFQEEGLAAAMSGWATAEFGLAQREIPVTFNREENRYIFDLPVSDD